MAKKEAKKKSGTSQAKEALAARETATKSIIGSVIGNNAVKVDAQEEQTIPEETASTNGANEQLSSEENVQQPEPSNEESGTPELEKTSEPRNTGAKNGERPKRNGKKKGVVVEHPAVQRALSKSRVQRTVRIEPLLWISYEEACEAKGMPIDFNNHVSEAFAQWLEKFKRQ